MKRFLVASLAGLATLAALAVSSSAQTPTPPAFPSATTDVFISAATLLPSGEQHNNFTRGSVVTFRVFAADLKAKKVVTPAEAKYFYITIPGQPSLKLAYGTVGSRALWTAKWTVPATYPLGRVDFKVLIQTKTHRYGSFVQPAVANAMLTITG